VAVLGGLLLLASNTRMRGALGGWLAAIAGAWFAIGPAVSLTWEHGRGPIGAPLGGTTRQALELLGYFYGLGALIVALAAFAVGRFASRPHLAEDSATVDAAAVRSPVTATRVPEPAHKHPSRRRPWPFARGRTTTPRGDRTA
jgi:hypothetical protein